MKKYGAVGCLVFMGFLGLIGDAVAETASVAVQYEKNRLNIDYDRGVTVSASPNKVELIIDQRVFSIELGNKIKFSASAGTENIKTSLSHEDVVNLIDFYRSLNSKFRANIQDRSDRISPIG